LSRGAYDVEDSSIALHFASEMAQTWQIRNGEIGIGDFVFVREGTEAYAEAVDRAKALSQVAPYIAAMKSTLRNLVTAEEAHFADFTTYTSNQNLLKYWNPPPEIDVEITIFRGPPIGYGGIATHTGTSISCAIYINRAARYPARVEGVPGCT